MQYDYSVETLTIHPEHNYDNKLVKVILKRFEELKAKIEADIIPARLEDYPDNWQCNNCEYREICMMANGGEVKWNDFKKKIESQGTKSS